MSMDNAASRLISAMRQTSEGGKDPPQIYIGTVLNGSEEALKIRCNGQELEREDLWLPPRMRKAYSPVPVGEDQLRRGVFELETGDTVLLFTPDQQEYFIIDKVVPLA